MTQNLKKHKMNKYFGAKGKEFTKQQLIDIVNSYNELGYYMPIDECIKIFGCIKINNSNNGSKGRCERRFYEQENGMYISK